MLLPSTLDRPRASARGSFASRRGSFASPRLRGFAGPSTGLAAAERTSSEEAGIAILAALSIAGIHSAVCPSYFTMRAFAADGPNKSQAVTGLWISLGLSTVASAAIWFVFDSLTAAIASEATALALFGIGMYALNAPLPTAAPAAVAPAPARAA